MTKKLFAGAFLLTILVGLLSAPYFLLWPNNFDAILFLNIITLAVYIFFFSTAIIQFERDDRDFCPPRLLLELSKAYILLSAVSFYGLFAFLFLAELWKNSQFVFYTVIGIGLVAIIMVFFMAAINVLFKCEDSN